VFVGSVVMGSDVCINGSLSGEVMGVGCGENYEQVSFNSQWRVWTRKHFKHTCSRLLPGNGFLHVC
jgi:hypothetical protein